MPKIVLRHPKLKQTIARSKRQAAVLKASGWVQDKSTRQQPAQGSGANDTEEN